jgi:hypothetical protein
LNIEMDEVLQAWRLAPHRRYGHRAIDSAYPVFGDSQLATFSGVAIDLHTGLRALLSAKHHGVTQVVAAASSPPPWALPHRIHDRWYIDAGLRSACSADLSPAADLLVVVAPIGGAHLSRWAALFECQTLRGVAKWTRRHRGTVLYIRPDRDVAKLAGPTVQTLLDPDCAQPTYEASYRLALRRIGLFRDEHPAQWTAAIAASSVAAA